MSGVVDYVAFLTNKTHASEYIASPARRLTLCASTRGIFKGSARSLDAQSVIERVALNAGGTRSRESTTACSTAKLTFMTLEVYGVEE